jgi:2-haloacid dehalogenase
MKVLRGVLFDVFGTVCDWCGPMADEIAALSRQYDEKLDAFQFARDWRNEYALQTSRRGIESLPWVPLTDLTRSALEELLKDRFRRTVEAADIDRVNSVWRRLRPWPDTVRGLKAIQKLVPIGTCSNGNFEDMEKLSFHLGIDWNAILGAEASGFYKPHPETYLQSVQGLGIKPEECLMTASHQTDLSRAKAQGLMTAFVRRPDEFGGRGMGEELEVVDDWTYVANDFFDLASQIKRN